MVRFSHPTLLVLALVAGCAVQLVPPSPTATPTPNTTLVSAPPPIIASAASAATAGAPILSPRPSECFPPPGAPIVALSGHLFDPQGNPYTTTATVHIESNDPSAPYARDLVAIDGQFSAGNVPARINVRIGVLLDCGQTATRVLDTNPDPRSSPLPCSTNVGALVVNFGGPASAADPDAPRYPVLPCGSPSPVCAPIGYDRSWAIFGHLYDRAGVAVQGALVTVTSEDPSMPERSSARSLSTTDPASAGAYLVTMYDGPAGPWSVSISSGCNMAIVQHVTIPDARSLLPNNGLPTYLPVPCNSFNGTLEVDFGRQGISNAAFCVLPCTNP